MSPELRKDMFVGLSYQIPYGVPFPSIAPIASSLPKRGMIPKISDRPISKFLVPCHSPVLALHHNASRLSHHPRSPLQRIRSPPMKIKSFHNIISFATPFYVVSHMTTESFDHWLGRWSLPTQLERFREQEERLGDQAKRLRDQERRLQDR